MTFTFQSFTERIHIKAAIQMKIIRRVTKKYKIGTRMILFVLNKKSAEASITSIASFNDLNPIMIQHRNINAASEKKIIPTKSHY